MTNCRFLDVTGIFFQIIGDQSVPDRDAASRKYLQPLFRTESDNADYNGPSGPNGSGQPFRSGATDGRDAAEDAANRSSRGMSTTKLHSTSWGPTWRRGGPVPIGWAQPSASVPGPGQRRSPKSSVARLHDTVC